MKTVSLKVLQNLRRRLEAKKTSHSWLVSAIIDNQDAMTPKNAFQDIGYAIHWIAYENGWTDEAALEEVTRRLAEFKEKIAA